MSFIPRVETRTLDERSRGELGGSFVELEQGFTHYELANPTGRPTVVLVHGFSVPLFIFDPTFEYLSSAGLRLLRYDLFGRGFSDRPRKRYEMDLFVEQLRALLDELGFTAPVSLVGLSMGGPIVATFAARFPDRVDKLVLIDPSGVRPIGLSLLLRLAKLPGLGEVGMSLIGSSHLIRSSATDFFGESLVRHFQSRYSIQMQYRGFIRAILSTIRNGMLGSFLETYERVGKAGGPVLSFWGRQDWTVPLEHSDVLRAAIPQLELRVIENCGHLPHYEKPDEVNPLLLEFLRSK